MPLITHGREDDIILDTFIKSCSSIEFGHCVINSLNRLPVENGRFASSWSVNQTRLFLQTTENIVLSLARKYVHLCPLFAGISWEDREYLAAKNYRLYFQFHIAVFLEGLDAEEQIEWAFEPFAPLGKCTSTCF